jgi:uncharacterized protein GlcG (DUF336 family)
MSRMTREKHMVEISAAEAQAGIAAGIKKATEIGSPSSITIVDSGRNLIGFQRMDGALLASIEISQGKAYTARSLNMTSLRTSSRTARSTQWRRRIVNPWSCLRAACRSSAAAISSALWASRAELSTTMSLWRRPSLRC